MSGKSKYTVRAPNLARVVSHSRPKHGPNSNTAAIKNSDVNQAAEYSTRITQVQCVNTGTMVLTDIGEVYYCGDTRYGKVRQEPELDDKSEAKKE